MSIRRKRRQRGRRKALRREALITWERLQQQYTAPVPCPPYPGIIIPVIRTIMPKLIAEELVGVQPMTLPEGYSPTVNYRYNYDRTKKEISEQRKKERAAKKRQKRDVGKAARQAKAIIERSMG